LPRGGIPTKRQGRLPAIIQSCEPMPWSGRIGRLPRAGRIGPSGHGVSPCY
jgi:hypothetical protein